MDFIVLLGLLIFFIIGLIIGAFVVYMHTRPILELINFEKQRTTND